MWSFKKYYLCEITFSVKVLRGSVTEEVEEKSYRIIKARNKDVAGDLAFAYFKSIHRGKKCYFVSMSIFNVVE